MPLFADHQVPPLTQAAERLGGLEALHGYLTARLLTPEDAPVEDWFVRGFAVGSLDALSEQTHEALYEALEAIAAALRAGNFRFPRGTGSADIALWCAGFVQGIEVAESFWCARNDDYLDAGKALLPIHAMINPDLREMFAEPGQADDASSLDEWSVLVAPSVRKIAIYHFADDEVLELLLSEDDPFYEQFRDEELAAADDQILLERLQDLHDEVPRVLIDECIRRGEAMIPRLHALLADESNWSPDSADDGVWWSLVHAMNILGAQSGEAAGAALAAGLAQLRKHGEDEIWDWFHPHYAQLSSGKEAHIRPVLCAIMEDGTVSAYGRSIALDWLVSTFRAGEEGLEEVLDRAAAIMGDPAQDPDLRELIVCTLLDHPRERHRSALLEQVRINDAGERGLDYAFGVADVEDAFNEPRRPARDPGHFLSFYDPIAIRQRKLMWLKEDERANGFASQSDDGLWAPVETYVRETPKLGRNDPCPCGSGRKYKKCCLNKG